MERVRFNSGELLLEGVLNVPEGAGPFPAAVICHPHPLYGGSMNNNVVNALFNALVRSSFVSLKFNFRGVGGSEGEFNHGTGEWADVTAALSFISSIEEVNQQEIAVIGYSAGAAFGLPVASEDEKVRAMVAISPPLDMFNFDFLQSCLKDKLLISGSRDDFTPSSRFLAFCQMLSSPKEIEIVKEADHFWVGYEDTIAARVVAFLSSDP